MAPSPGEVGPGFLRVRNEYYGFKTNVERYLSTAVALIYKKRDTLEVRDSPTSNLVKTMGVLVDAGKYVHPIIRANTSPDSRFFTIGGQDFEDVFPTSALPEPTSPSCCIRVDWRNNTVTDYTIPDLPADQVAFEAKNKKLVLIKPDGRVLENFLIPYEFILDLSILTTDQQVAIAHLPIMRAIMAGLNAASGSSQTADRLDNT